jgi:hypothetical protein
MRISIRHILVIFSCVLLLSFKNDSSNQKQNIQTVLGMGVITGANSSVYSFAEIQINKTTKAMVGFQPITQVTFMRKATGLWPSLANPENINLFEAHGINCYPVYDSMKRVYNQFMCDQLLDMWKLRWPTHPISYLPDPEGIGWSNGKYKPSNAQQKYLWEHYNNANILNNYFYGEHLFQLFEDMQDSTWRANYQALTDSI